MNAALHIRHTVAIAGVVRKKAIAGSVLPATMEEQRNLEHSRRIGGAQIEIIVDEAPAAFQRLVAAKMADPTWEQQRERIDRTWSHSDGIFYFVDLPPGPGYRLRVTMPTQGTRFGAVESSAVSVPVRPPDRPARPVQVDLALPTTRIHGAITEIPADPADEPVTIAGALVRLRNDTATVRSDRNGYYLLDGLVAGRWMLEVFARGYQPFASSFDLVAGQDARFDVQLQTAMS